MKSIKIDGKYEVFFKGVSLGIFDDWIEAIPKAWELAIKMWEGI